MAGMVLDCFLLDKGSSDFWTIDVDPGQAVYSLDKKGEIFLSSWGAAPRLLSFYSVQIRKNDLAKKAEEILYQAAALNEPVLREDLAEHFERLDLELATVLTVRGVEIAVTHPEHLARYFTNKRGWGNLVLFNTRAVVPVRRPTLH